MTSPTSTSGQAEALEVVAALVTWADKDDSTLTWVETFASDLPALDRAKQHNGRVEPLVRLADAEARITAAESRAAAAEALIERIASGWDGCVYEGIGEDIDIGAAIRAADLNKGA